MKKKFRNFLYKFYKIGEPLVIFIEFMERLIAWTPILWKDKDWDYSYLLTMMQFKMNRMSKCIEDNAFILADKRVGKQLRYASFLIDLIKDPDNHPRVREMYADIEKKWGAYGPWTRIKTIGSSDDLLFTRENVKTKEDAEQYKKEFDNYSIAYAKVENDAKKRLFKFMDQYIVKWWD